MQEAQISKNTHACGAEEPVVCRKLSRRTLGGCGTNRNGSFACPQGRGTDVEDHGRAQAEPHMENVSLVEEDLRRDFSCS